jgi:hypothetical protein
MDETTIRMSRKDKEIYDDIWLDNYEAEEDPGLEQLILESIDWEPRWEHQKGQPEWDVPLCSTQAEHFSQWLSDQGNSYWSDICENERELKEKEDEDTREYMEDDREKYEWCKKMQDQVFAFHHPYYVVKGYCHEYETWNLRQRTNGKGVMHSLVYAMQWERDPTKQWVIVFDANRKEIFRLGPVPENIVDIIDATTKKYAR